MSDDGHDCCPERCHARRRRRCPHQRGLPHARAGHAERAARPDAGGQDLADAADGRPRRPDLGPRAGRRRRRDRRAGAASAASPWSTSSSSTIRRSPSTRTSPRRCASQGRPQRRDRPAGARDRAHCCTRALCSTACRSSSPAASSSAPRIARALVKGAGLVLLDEPLANLDYKLREELRAELPRIFARRRHVVYATTEPLEALMLGGQYRHACREGRVAADRPDRRGLSPAATLTGRGAVLRPADEHSCRSRRRRLAWATAAVGTARPHGHLAGLADGTLRVGFPRQPSRSSPAEAPDASCVRRRPVELTEITGSETFVHVERDGDALGGACAGRARARSWAQTVEVSSTPPASTPSTATAGSVAARRGKAEVATHGADRPRRPRPLLRAASGADRRTMR